MEWNLKMEKEETVHKRKLNYGPLMIILAACFWGSMGIFVRRLNAIGFTSIQIVAIRVTLAALIFSLILLIKDHKGFKISPKDIPLFLAIRRQEYYAKARTKKGTKYLDDA